MATINGTSGNDSLTGTVSSDTFYGYEGDDILDSGQYGYDTLVGGLGDDTYIADSNDVVIELANEGNDTVNSNYSFTLGNNLENLTLLSGLSNLTATGNSLNNVITGSVSNDVLNGLEGNDTLNGGTGADTMSGGIGNDYYVVENSNDVVIEDNNTPLIRVSVSSNSTQASHDSVSRSISANGTKVVFESFSANLVSGDTNGSVDIFVKDLSTGELTLVSSSSSGGQANGHSSDAYISGDGTKVVFSSLADNLVAGDTNNEADIFVKDLSTGELTRVNTSSSGVEANYYTYDARISGDGSKVVFTSQAYNLVAGSSGSNVFVKDLNTGVLTRVNTNSSGIGDGGGSGEANISADGTKVVFTSFGSDLVANDTNNTSDIFVKDLSTGVTTLVSTSSSGSQANHLSDYANISADGTKVVFLSRADNLVSGDINVGYDLFIKDLTTGEITRINTDSSGSGNFSTSFDVGISADGSKVVFGRAGYNGFADAFIKDLTTGQTTSLSTSSTGVQANYNSFDANISADGTKVIFSTEATNLVANDTNLAIDVFVKDIVENIDTVQASLNHTLSNNVENLTLTGSSHINGTGNDLNNQITGNSGNNTLDGGAGTDILSGGLGSDTYIVDLSSDVVIELVNEGTDIIQSSASYTLSATVENLTLTGSSHINGTGNDFNNQITGNSGNNTLDGGAGVDTLSGGLGNDLYIVDSTTDTISDGGGSDTVRSSVAFTLTAASGVENLTLTGSSNINGTGNSLNNVIIANDGHNSLDGGAGQDVLQGDSKYQPTVLMESDANVSVWLDDHDDDSVTLDLGTNTIVLGDQTFTGTQLHISSNGTVNLGSTAFTNEANGPVLVSSLPNYGVAVFWDDLATSKNASDKVLTRFVDDNNDGSSDRLVIQWNAYHRYGDSYPLLQFQAEFALNTVVEGVRINLFDVTQLDIQIGSEPVATIGVKTPTATEDWSLSSTISQTTFVKGAFKSLFGGNDTLNGGAGIDTLIGGWGDDSYIADSISDVVFELANEGFDIVYASDSYTLSDNIENLVLTNTSNINGTGNGQDNVITGNSGNNILNGGLGTDTLVGGLGDDTYIAESTIDEIIELVNEGTDTVQATVSYTLGDNIERLVLTGSNAINGTGNSLNNVITGNSANNTLSGGEGADTLIGGLGDDTFIVENVNDVAIEENSSPSIVMASTKLNGDAGDGSSFSSYTGGAVTADGSKVVFRSFAENLVVGDTNYRADIFVKDLSTGVVTRVNTSSSGSQADKNGEDASISANGTKVVFASDATNLLARDTAYRMDIFIKDLATGVITLVNTNSSGGQAANYSYSYSASISANGTKVAFVSTADNLVAGDTNYDDDVFVKDLSTGVLTRVSVTSIGGQVNDSSSSPNISADGTKVVFTSRASNLVTGDTNGQADIFVKNLSTGATTLVSSDSSGGQVNGGSDNANISADGTKVVFTSRATNLVAGDTNAQADIFVKDLVTGVVTRVSTNSSDGEANGASQNASITADGTKVLFTSSASNLVTGDTNNQADIFIKDLVTGVVTRMSTNSSEVQANGASEYASISADGSKVLFASSATNLVAVDTNGQADIFVKSLSTPDNSLDTVQSSVNYTLGNNLENLVLTGSAALTGTGNSQNNVITGNSGNNILDGKAGNDTLDGGAGVDTLLGGLGNDIYVVDSSEDVATELASQGVDTVQASVSYPLLANIGNLVLTGSSNTNATGNSLNNVITGNNGNNSLAGAAGNDTLDGGAGQDTAIYSGTWSQYVVTGTIENATVSGLEGTDSLSNIEFLSFNGLAVSLLDAINDAPVSVNDSNTSDAVIKTTSTNAGDATAIGNVLTNDTDSNLVLGDQLSVTAVLGNGSLVGLSATGIYGSMVMNADGSYVYTLDENDSDTIALQSGQNVVDSFSYQISDIHGLTSTSSLNVSINGGVDAITITTGSSTTLTLGQDNLVLTGTSNLNGTGNASNNSITGNSGNNILNGGAGVDTLIGGLGNDSYYVDNSTDVVTELSTEGIDTVYTTTNYTLSANLEKLILLSGALNGIGNSEDNSIIGNSSNNSLSSGAGNDTLNGGAGADTLIGGVGNDLYFIDSASDVVTELANEGTDTVYSEINYILGITFENLVLLGSGSLTGEGNNRDNDIVGNIGNNLLTGLEGNDTLNGGTGVDILIGGLGNDVYYVDNTSDVVTEIANEGADTVYSTINYTLNETLENLVLIDVLNINGTGNSQDNSITGNSGKNSLIGGMGNDTLNGGVGIDTLTGGAGNDVYYVDNTSDVITELANEGLDVVYSTASYTLSNHIENLLLTGALNINASGNALENVLTGNGGNNSLNGGIGADTLVGGLGNDTYVIDNTGDVVTELLNQGLDTVQASINYTLGDSFENLTLTGSNNINAIGNSVNNVITGNSGSNSLTGGLGNDTLTGGMGNDRYMFARGAGQDTIIDMDSTVGNTDTLSLGTAVSRDQVWFSRTGNHLEVSLIGTTDKVTINNWYIHPNNRVEIINLEDDGRSLLASQVQNLVTAMASLTPPPVGQTTLNTAQHTALDAVIAAAWV